MDLSKKIHILTDVFNMNKNDIKNIIQIINNTNIEPIIDILYCYIDKPNIIYEIFSKYTDFELNIISYIINSNKLTYSHCVDLFSFNGLQLRLFFSFYNIIILSYNDHVNKLNTIFDIFKNMDNNTLINFYKIKSSLNINEPLNFMDLCNISKHFNSNEIERFIIAMNLGYSYKDSYLIAINLFFNYKHI